MNKEFLDFVETLMNENPERTKELMTENIEAYLNMLKDAKKEKPEITKNGAIILSFLKDNIGVKCWTAKDIADRIDITSRGVSGALRKLVNDGFCDKMGTNPAIYSLTEKGKNYIIKEE